MSISDDVWKRFCSCVILHGDGAKKINIVVEELLKRYISENCDEFFKRDNIAFGGPVNHGPQNKFG